MRGSRLNIRPLLTACTALLALTWLAPGLAAQVNVDSRWLPWVGCWEVVGDVRAVDSQVICVDPVEGDPTTVELISEAEGAEPELLWSDARERVVSQAGCEGTQRSYFSPDGHRVYVAGSYVCDDGAVQEGRGLLAMVSADEWVDIRSLTQGEETVVVAQRYVAATPAAIRAAGRVELTSPRTELSRRLAAAAPDIQELEEVYEATGKELTMAWLLESGSAMDLDADALVTLADAGIEPEVIDVAIAMSYPDDFSLRTGPGDQLAQAEKISPRQGNANRWYSPFANRVRMTYGFWGPSFSAFGPFGLNSWFFNGWNGFSPFGGWGWGGVGFRGGGWGGWNGWGGGGAPIVIRGGDGGTGSGGRAVAGRGYRRPSGTSSPVRGQARTPIAGPPRSGPPRSGSARPSGSAGPSRGSVSRGAAGRSSAGQRTARPRRTAKPRRGGGGG